MLSYDLLSFRNNDTVLFSSLAPIGQAIHRLLLIQAFRPDRLLAMAHTFVSANLGESFMSIMEQPLDLTHIVDTEVNYRQENTFKLDIILRA